MFQKVVQEAPPPFKNTSGPTGEDPVGKEEQGGAFAVM